MPRQKAHIDNISDHCFQIQESFLHVSLSVVVESKNAIAHTLHIHSGIAYYRQRHKQFYNVLLHLRTFTLCFSAQKCEHAQTMCIYTKSNV